MRRAIWIGIFIGSTIGGFIPALWGDDLFSYSGVLFSGSEILFTPYRTDLRWAPLLKKIGLMD